MRVSRLETGIRQKGSLHRYRLLGCGETPPFANERDDPLSAFMEKGWLDLAGPRPPDKTRQNLARGPGFYPALRMPASCS
jgi:hypothetical protein